MVAGLEGEARRRRRPAGARRRPRRSRRPAPTRRAGSGSRRAARRAGPRGRRARTRLPSGRPSSGRAPGAAPRSACPSASWRPCSVSTRPVASRQASSAREELVEQLRGALCARVPCGTVSGSLRAARTSISAGHPSCATGTAGGLPRGGRRVPRAGRYGWRRSRRCPTRRRSLRRCPRSSRHPTGRAPRRPRPGHRLPQRGRRRSRTDPAARRRGALALPPARPVGRGLAGEDARRDLGRREQLVIAAPLGQAGPDLAVAGLALLHQRDERGGDEDRGVRPGRQADEQREAEVLERRRAEDLRAEDEHGQDRHDGDERGVDRARQRLVHRQVDEVGEGQTVAWPERFFVLSRTRSNTTIVSYSE